MFNNLIKIYYRIKAKKNINDFFISLNRKILVTFYKTFNMYPSSKPFLTGDTFRQLSTTTYCNKKLDLNKNEIIFVELYLLKFFQDQINDIKKSFILISHNGDNLVNEQYDKIINNKFLIKWYSANVVIKNKKIIPIPIGLQNRNCHHFGVTSHFKNLRINKQKKIPRVFCSFNFDTNPKIRKKALKTLIRLESVDVINGLTAHEYRKILSTYMFVASPEGNGVDTYRTWESLYLNAIPIVIRNNLYSQFKNFPALVLDDWRELGSYTEHDLKKIYKINLKKLKSCKYIWYDYWKKNIQSSLKKIKVND